MIDTAISYIKAAIERDRGLCCLVMADEVEDAFELTNLLEFRNVKFIVPKNNVGKPGRPGMFSIVDVFSAFIKDADLIKASVKEVQVNGKTFMTWMSRHWDFMFRCEKDPRTNAGSAGECAFYIFKDAPNGITRRLRGVLAKYTTNVANNRGNKNATMLNRYKYRFAREERYRAEELGLLAERNSDHDDSKGDYETEILPETLQVLLMAMSGRGRIRIN